MSTVYDSCLFRNIFSTESIRAIFSDDAYIANMIYSEVCLAKAQGEYGVIPKEAGDKLYEMADQFVIDKELIGNETDIVGYCVLPLLNQMTKQVPDLGKYLHWGATTQDIMDDASMLQVKQGLEVVEKYLNDIIIILHDLAEKYKDTPMAGRTHFQQALPVTFGYKCAVWVSGLKRCMDRLQQAKPRCLLAQFGGAAGTLASLGPSDIGLKVRRRLAELLGLNDPSITWHVSRDGVAEILLILAIIGGCLGKIGLDIIAMSADELDEVAEPFVPHRGASSTMPQKRNPISAEYMLAASKITRANAGLALDAMIVDFERASGPWHLEWACIPESFIATVGSLHQTKFVLGGLVVKPDKMKKNLATSKGLIVAEAVMMGLAPKLGRHKAHDVVYNSCVKAYDNDKSLLEVLLQDESINMDEASLRKLCDPVNYLGATNYLVNSELATPYQFKAANGHSNGHSNGTSHLNGVV